MSGSDRHRSWGARGDRVGLVECWSGVEGMIGKGPSSQGYGFSCGHVWMWKLDCEESWALKKWCFWTVVLENTLESPMDSKEIQPVHPKEISPEYSLEGLMLKLKLQNFGHLMGRADSLIKTLMLGKTEGWRRRGWQRMDGWMASPTQWTWVWVGSGSWWQGSLACWDSWGCKESDTTERLN